MKKILLVSPAELNSVRQSSWQLHRNPLVKKRAFTTPLQLATIAALAGDDYVVDIWDEQVRGAIDEPNAFSKEYDLIGVTGYSIHINRAKQIAKTMRERGFLLAVGGAGVSSMPEAYREHFDILFVGESELTWPQFLAEFRNGTYQSEYRETGMPDMALMPMPKWDSIADSIASDYMMASVQVTRGCPFDCEFCDIWQIFGRKVRVKPTDQVVREITALERLGAHSILLCSDNFVGNRKYAKDLVRALRPMNRSFKEPLIFRTELTITVARDEELLEMMADANFGGFLVGIESPSEDSLSETRKTHNMRFGDLTQNCLKIMSYGVPIDGSMIVGFDSDTTDIFDLHFQFLQEACIPYPRPHLLKAIRGTDLWRRLTKEGRVVDIDDLIGEDGGKLKYVDAQYTSNVVPAKLTRVELFSGYLGMIEKIYDWKHVTSRLKGFIDNVSREPKIERTDRGLVAHLRRNFEMFDQESGEAIEYLLSYTERQAPFMAFFMAILCLRNYHDIRELPRIRESLLRTIEFEEEMEFGARIRA